MVSRSALYIVATPIGNLDDLTLRAKTILNEVDFIAAEDTRHSGRLFAHFGIETPAIAFHEHSGSTQLEKLLEELESGKSIALISDAGTPLISDPGYPLSYIFSFL
jgi:16S rRNA (cytidine1402-2'-O)-methyltransferase